MSSKSKNRLVIECNNTLTAEEGASPPLPKSEEEEEDEGRCAKSLAFDGHEKGGLFAFFFKFYRLITNPNRDVPGRLLAGKETGPLSPPKHPSSATSYMMRSESLSQKSSSSKSRRRGR
ncbi:hypothetical protein F2Q70_00020527 [Brassica cretica]|uniref:Uncharacterized protein n=1 Tax=Brassica cretica TaxID=69181 RepID=A0A8S9HK80_BRACR|nr:hypothetical protein F2Q70_00020527 [Brassica cretica]KAF2556816.1 hypothetical protein F2Q68_00014049 [Brassica cretica]